MGKFSAHIGPHLQGIPVFHPPPPPVAPMPLMHPAFSRYSREHFSKEKHYICMVKQQWNDQGEPKRNERFCSDRL